eukprot:CAMPEP_0177715232 /NCGR_PEP_ID=MMETSP0484_2-20121128/13883_1 /TAXON_ID=354590 /ORGANISM="Rhodomonas lens, Strain RHODO" /LENGTH=327 /DNA_ID=CAMNT_0019227215 /DNA_START=43 /DNA_END=1026 /DNA_ORIENTATION=+
MGDSATNAAAAISSASSWTGASTPAPAPPPADGSNPGVGDTPGSAGASAQQRGVYWKRNDSMRLVHLLIDTELRPAFLSMEPQPHRAAMEPNVLTYKQFWALAASKFNDDEWQPPHLFPNDPHLNRCRSFTPTKKSKEVDPNYLREKYKALRRQFNNSIKRWEEGGQNKIENFWKCSGVAPGTSDEGCWYMFLVLWVGKHEDVLNVILDKQIDSSHQFSMGGGDGMQRGSKRQRSFGFFDDAHADYAPELQMELKAESQYKQQTEVLKFVQMCYSNIASNMDEDQRAFWRAQLVLANAQLVSVQAKLPQPPPPPAPQNAESEGLEDM